MRFFPQFGKLSPSFLSNFISHLQPGVTGVTDGHIRTTFVPSRPAASLS